MKFIDLSVVKVEYVFKDLNLFILVHISFVLQFIISFVKSHKIKNCKSFETSRKLFKLEDSGSDFSGKEKLLLEDLRSFYCLYRETIF